MRGDESFKVDTEALVHPPLGGCSRAATLPAYQQLELGAEGGHDEAEGLGKSKGSPDRDLRGAPFVVHGHSRNLLQELARAAVWPKACRPSRGQEGLGEVWMRQALVSQFLGCLAACKRPTKLFLEVFLLLHKSLVLTNGVAELLTTSCEFCLQAEEATLLVAKGVDSWRAVADNFVLPDDWSHGAGLSMSLDDGEELSVQVHRDGLDLHGFFHLGPSECKTPVSHAFDDLGNPQKGGLVPAQMVVVLGGPGEVHLYRELRPQI
mmetsp:Transcript_7992/g.22694  ORF Transcript_7992/g.22694 Transcript_7992/m.22694 type:complete len:264 (-) Transcript_7992:56-847(-)